MVEAVDFDLNELDFFIGPVEPNQSDIVLTSTPDLLKAGIGRHVETVADSDMILDCEAISHSRPA